MMLLGVRQTLSRMIVNLLNSNAIPFILCLSVGFTIFSLIVVYGVVGLIGLFDKEWWSFLCGGYGY